MNGENNYYDTVCMVQEMNQIGILQDLKLEPWRSSEAEHAASRSRRLLM